MMPLMTLAQADYDASTPIGLTRGSPAGSYALTGFDNVNLFNGHMNFHLPLLSIGGRGTAGYTMTLPIEQVWTADLIDPVNFFYAPNYNWWDGIKPGYGAGVIQTRHQSEGCPEEPFSVVYGVTRLTVTLADGTEYELIDSIYGGQPAASICDFSNFDPQNGVSRGTTWVTRDGTAATFISDTPIRDVLVATSGPWVTYPTGHLRLANGMTYRFVQGHIQWFRDANGNKVTFEYTNSKISAITDSLNRRVTIEYDVQDPTYGLCDRISFKGYGGATRILRVQYKNLADALDTGQTTKTYSGTNGLFPELHGSTTTLHNPRVTSGVVIPDGRSYQFRYNSYGEVTRVTLPTEGVFTYLWGAGLDTGPPSGAATPRIYRRVLEKRVYSDNGSTLAGLTIFGRYDNVMGPEGSVVVKQCTIDGAATVISQTKHYFHGGPLANMYVVGMWLPDLIEGREKKTERFNQAGSTVLERATMNWIYGGTLAGTSINPRVSETVTTIEPAAANLVSKQTFSYDSYNNQTDVYEYGFGTGSPGALVRQTHTDYLTTNPVNGINYATNTSIHLRSLVKKQEVFSGSTLRARTTNEYDNYATDANHASLTNRTSISGLDAAFTTSYLTRGNTTAATFSLVNTSGTETGSTSSYAQYDIAGNMVKAIDARGYATDFDFSDRFGTPDGNAQANSGSTELGSQISYAFATRVTNPLGHISYTQFDYYLGMAVNSEDPNAVISGFQYVDGIDRLTEINRGVGTGSANRTAFAYDDTNRIITTSSDLHTVTDGLLITKVLYDGLGRTIESRQYEGGGNFIATQTQYDALSRAFKSSNPFRPWQSQTAVFTTQAFDALGRIVSVTTPDNAVVSTSYSGNTVTVTDQAGKIRKSVSDALGRLIDVYEDPAGLNYQTTYTYDVMDNLVKVTQGSQQRFFMYDSFKRLIRARNPEQSTVAGLSLSDPLTGNSAWSIGFQYDANGNLTQRTDPRGVVSTYVYDALNRNTTLDHSDTSSINPDVKRFYDGATNGKGRFWYNYTGGDFSTGSNVEHTSTDSYDELGRPLVQRQLFKLNGTWSPTYQISRTYNRAGGITSQTYPSGHVVNYNYDNAGRTADKDAQNLAFTGNLGDGVQRTYASGNTYSEWGSLSRERFGTQTPLYHKLFYNVRGQRFDTRVSSVNDTWDWNRGRLILYYSSNHIWGQSGTDNNGNLRFAETWIPPENATLDQAQVLIEHAYNYDSLNRITSVIEQKLEMPAWVWQQQFQQSYTYDRYGNRTINAAQTWGTGINAKQFTADTTTNRLGVPGGQPGVMTYDSAGNLTTDTYTGVGNRTYDAENRITLAADNSGQTSRYTYDADGQRTRRQVAGSQEEWQIYGFDRELLAEYRALAPASSPQKEYGYRNGQLLVTATGRFNVALAANGAVATASSTATYAGFSTTGAINGNYRGPWGNSLEGWNDATANSVPDWIQIDFAGSKTIDEINVFSLHDNYTQENTPTETQTFSLYGLLAFDVQYWNGSSWVTIPGGSVTGNNKVWRKFTFSAITTSKIRVFINTVPDAWSRVVEIQAFGTSAGGNKVQWLVPDHLGTPRMVIDETGSLAGVNRHDYLPFGEELFAGTGGRSPVLGYGSDGVRQQFTSKERDIETGLDYFINRYHSSVQGRFISVDPTLLSANRLNPQTWNRYSYVTNRPLGFVDPFGLWKHRVEAVKDKDGKIKEYVVMFYKSKPGDNAESLLKQLGYKAGTKEGAKLLASIEKNLGTGDSVQASKLAGIVGRVFKVVNEGETAQRMRPATKNGGPTLSTLHDCSMTTFRSAFPSAAAPYGGAGMPRFATPAGDALLNSRMNTSDPRSGDVVRYGNDMEVQGQFEKNFPTHFMSVLYTDDDGITQAFSRTGENGKFEIVPTTQFNGGNYGQVQGKKGDASGFYRPPF
jgi:RHS repeat-associated protein